MRTSLLLALLLLVGGLAAQSIELTRENPVVFADKQQLFLAWVGGLNNPQPAMEDLDGDGDTELYIFDRQGHRHLGFQREENGSFTFDPALTEFFPSTIPHWVLLRDYDDDGVVDIFGHSDTLVSGVLVYKGRRLADGRLAFDRQRFGDILPLLFFPLSNGSRTQIFVSTIDYPAIDDIDCDGDLDILTFNTGGGYVEFYQNQSIEQGYGRDSLIFELEEDCYGGIYESGLSPAVTLAASPNACATPFQGPGNTAGARHAGSTLLTLDNNQDGLLELLLGDISFTEIVLLNNNGTCEDAWFNSQELDYPQNDVPVDIVFYPASFYTDIDQDGVKDFIAAPNQLLNAENVDVFWYYRNEGADDLPVPVLQDSQFLVRDMIDVGTGSIPVAFDVNDDGLTDLIIANQNLYSGTTSIFNSRLVVYRNIGTNTEPVFELSQLDYLGMSQFLNTTNEFAPAFGDLNGDGRPDAIVGGRDGQLFFFPNTSSAGQPHTFGQAVYPFMNINVGQNARPQIVDLNRDGLADLVIGTRSGRINYYQNQGTVNNPMFIADVLAAPNQIQLGGIDTRNIGSSIGYAAPLVIEQDEETYLLLTGTNRGQIEAYGDIEGNLDGTFTLLDENVGNYRTGFRSELTAANFNNDDKYDIILGNGRGGVEYFSSSIDFPTGPSSTHGIISQEEHFLVFPNPARDQINVTISHSAPGQLRLFDIRGREVLRRNISEADTQVSFSVANLPVGVYSLQWISDRGSSSRKLVINR